MTNKSYILIIALLFLCSCGAVMNQAHQAKALSLLKAYSSAQSIAYMEQNTYLKSLAELQQYGMTTEAFDASNEVASPNKIGDYLFAILPSDELEYKCGLCAYPESSSSSSPVMLVILDEGDFEFNEETGQPAMGGSPLSLWKIDRSKVTCPLTEFPDRAILESQWTRFDRKLKR